ncbi:MAG TPA: hypothetical protein VNN80_32690 [Polyangiaceae bacterium]|nr:hypothetical protein [Polyangiaceae bacterium]
MLPESPPFALDALDVSRTGLREGSYRYDTKSGLWGLEGGDSQGFAPAGLALGGLLRKDASRRSTGIRLKGRNLRDTKLLGLEALPGILLPPARYALDAPRT